MTVWPKAHIIVTADNPQQAPAHSPLKHDETCHLERQGANRNSKCLDESLKTVPEAAELYESGSLGQRQSGLALVYTLAIS